MMDTLALPPPYHEVDASLRGACRLVVPQPDLEPGAIVPRPLYLTQLEHPRGIRGITWVAGNKE